MVTVLRSSGIQIQKDAVVFHRDFKLLVKNFNQNLDSITLFAAREMATFRDSISVERKAIMLDLDETSNKVVKTALEEIRMLVKDVLFYLIIILIVILLIPFTAGFITGKAFSKNNKKNK